ncbi:MAG: hypothetical protein Q4F84_02870 [Fibrobacter sp.]|nr:hypothetical protein [Fibrobacter sp.]
MCLIKKYTVLLLAILFVSNLHANSSYEELVPKFSRTTSRIMVRKVQKPTLANLDMAAYDKNPLLLDNADVKPEKMVQSVLYDTLTFGNTVSSPANSFSETPLSKNGQFLSVAMKPFLKRLWSVVKDDNLAQQASKVSAYKWNDPKIYQPFQEISTAYFYEENNHPQIWVKIEFALWALHSSNISDSDNDGIKEIYAKLSLENIHDDTLTKIVDWVKNSYCKSELPISDIDVWVTELTSYWYPSLNTDLVDIGKENLWPDKRVSKKIRKELKGQFFKNPFAVIEGKPFDPKKPVYNVFIVETDSSKTGTLTLAQSSNISAQKQDSAISENFRSNMIRFDKELSAYGTYNEWNAKNENFLNGVKSWLNQFPKEQMGLVGVNEWLFFRRSAETLVKPDFQTQIKTAIDHITDFKTYLDKRNINFLFVVIPDKEMIYFDKFSNEIPSPQTTIICSHERELLKQLQEANIETIDLLPAFLESKETDNFHSEFLYQKDDTHWSNRGIAIAADLIAKRICEYSWYSDLQKHAYFTKDTIVERTGDIVERLPENIQRSFPPQKVLAKQVFCIQDTTLFKSDKNAPVMLIGDSFTGVFESVDCKGAGIGANIATKTQLPIDIITSWGGGPLVRNKALRMRQNELGSKRLVVYLMVSRDIFNYSLEWEPLSVPK